MFVNFNRSLTNSQQWKYAISTDNFHISDCLIFLNFYKNAGFEKLGLSECEKNISAD